MKLATIRVGGTTRAVRADGDLLADRGAADLGEFLASADWARRAAAVGTSAARTYAAAGADFATLVPNPSKIEGLSTLANTVSKDSTVAKEVA
jgi:acylpyruvate hydrolase